LPNAGEFVPGPNPKSRLEHTHKPVLHPQAFNFRAIDGVIVQKQSKPEKGRAKRRMFMLLQITLAETHSESDENFFSEWGKWIDGLEEFEVVPTFVWIIKEGGK
jgi:hypothetical protein